MIHIGRFFSIVCLMFCAVAFCPLDDRLPQPIAEPGDDSLNMEHERGSGPSFAEQVVEIVNAERDAMGLPPLKAVALLNSTSLNHSTNMGVRNFFAHCDLDTGLSPFQRMTAAGYNWNAAAENIAAGQNTPAAVMIGWMNSSGHRANILSSSFREIGVGFYFDAADVGNVRQDNDGNCVTDSFNNGPYQEYWTQNFGTRNSVFPMIINQEAYETDQIEVDLFLYGQGVMTEIRLRNDGGSFTSWMPFDANPMWELNPVDGTRTVTVEMRNAAMQIFSASDTIELANFFSCDMPSNLIMWPMFNILPFVTCIGN